MPELRDYWFTNEEIDFLLRLVRNNAEFEDDEEDERFFNELANKIEDQIVNHPENE